MALTGRKADPEVVKMLKVLLTEPEMEMGRGGYWLYEGTCRIHHFIPTGKTREISFPFFRRHTEREERCTKCGATRWN